VVVRERGERGGGGEERARSKALLPQAVRLVSCRKSSLEAREIRKVRPESRMYRHEGWE